MIHVGLVGFGLSGRYFHAPFLTVNAHFTVKKAMTRNAQSVHDFDKNIEVVGTFEDILADKSIELVFICTPNHLHFSYAKAALEAGKHVVIEKPFANNQADAKKLIKIAEKRGLMLTAYQNRRWDADFLTIQKLINSDALGNVVEFECYFDRFRPEVLADTWKESVEAGAGNLYNLGPHLIDQVLVLFGTPRYVTAIQKTIRPTATIDDFFDIRLDYDNKQIRLHSSLMAFENSLRFKIHGTKGTFIKHGLDIQEDTLRANALPNTADWGQEPQNQWGTLYSEGNAPRIIETEAGNYMPFYQNLYDNIRQQTPLIVKPSEALNTTRVIDLVQKSSKTGKRLTF